MRGSPFVYSFGRSVYLCDGRDSDVRIAMIPKSRGNSVEPITFLGVDSDDVVFQCDQRVYVGKMFASLEKGVPALPGTYHNSLLGARLAGSCPDEVLAGLFSWQMNDGRTHVGAFTSRGIERLFVRECDGLTILPTRDWKEYWSPSVKYVPPLDRNTMILDTVLSGQSWEGKNNEGHALVACGGVRSIASFKTDCVSAVIVEKKQELSFLVRKIARVGTSVVAFGDCYPRRAMYASWCPETGEFQETVLNVHDLRESIDDLFHFSPEEIIVANRGYGAFAESVRLYDAFVGKGAIPSFHRKRSADEHLPAWCFWNYDSRRERREFGVPRSRILFQGVTPELARILRKNVGESRTSLGDEWTQRKRIVSERGSSRRARA